VERKNAMPLQSRKGRGKKGKKKKATGADKTGVTGRRETADNHVYDNTDSHAKEGKAGPAKKKSGIVPDLIGGPHARSRYRSKGEGSKRAIKRPPLHWGNE